MKYASLLLPLLLIAAAGSGQQLTDFNLSLDDHFHGDVASAVTHYYTAELGPDSVLRKVPCENVWKKSIWLDERGREVRLVRENCDQKGESQGVFETDYQGDQVTRRRTYNSWRGDTSYCRIQQLFYDPAGDRTERSDPCEPASQEQTYLLQYNAAGIRTRELELTPRGDTTVIRDFSVEPTGSNRYRLQYPHHRRIVELDSAGRTTLTVYLQEGLEKARVGSVYDEAGRIRTQTHYNWPEYSPDTLTFKPGAWRYQITYNLQGDPARIRFYENGEPAGHSELQWEYDDAGNWVRWVSFKNNRPDRITEREIRYR